MRHSEETERLRRSWMRHEPEMLRDYLVAGIHDPRLNPQSIHGRHFLVDRTFGPRFLPLREEEFHFAATLLWLRGLTQRGVGGSDWEAILHAIDQRADNAEGLPIPDAVVRTASRLPRETPEGVIPDFVRGAIRILVAEADSTRALDLAADLLTPVWREWLLKAAPVCRPRVIEPACGSANDFRILHRYGLAAHLDYLGFDLCDTNIGNARELCPEGHFEVGNVFEIGAPDLSADLCLVHDLLEHLSPEGLETALHELHRVTRHALFVAFFQMHEGPEHIVRPVEEYHWNTLSLPRLRSAFGNAGFDTQAVHVASWFRHLTGMEEAVYYDTAYDLTAQRLESSR